MKTKILLLGAVAGLVTCGSALAADLPMTKADAVEYVKVCSQFGPGFFYIPGTDTCLQISGIYRADYQYGSSNRVKNLVDGVATRGSNKALDQSNFQGRAQLGVDARTQTDWGLLRSYLLIDMYTGSSGPSNWSTGKNFQGSSGLYMDKAYIQFGGLTAGYAESFYAFYDAFYGNTFFAPYFGSGFIGTKQQLAYTAQFGGGFTATIDIQDPKAGNGNVFGGVTDGVIGNVAYAGSTAPDIIANVNYTGDIGKFQLMGALHRTSVLPVADANTSDSKWGYAIGAGAAVNIPVLAGGYIAVEADYADGANSYTGVVDNEFSPAGSPGAYDAVETNTGLKNAKSWAIVGEAGLNLTPQLKAMLFGSYGHYDSPLMATDNGPLNGDFTAYQFGGQLNYTVVKGLTIGAEVYYARTNAKTPGFNFVEGQDTSGVDLAKSNTGSVVGGLRIARTF